jgi:hypothetical protein
MSENKERRISECIALEIDSKLTAEYLRLAARAAWLESMDQVYKANKPKLTAKDYTYGFVFSKPDTEFKEKDQVCLCFGPPVDKCPIHGGV